MARYFDKAKFGERLAALMEDNNDTTYSLGEYLQLSNSTVSRYLSGDISPKTTTIQAIAEKYRVNPAWLAGAEGAEKYIEGVNYKKIPIIGTIAAGVGILAHENIEGYECAPDNANVDFCLRVKGDSMINARILDGDIVFIRQQPDVENGEIAVVLFSDREEATLKRVYKLDGSIILRAENPNYKEHVYTKKEAKNIRILGKAIFFKSEVK